MSLIIDVLLCYKSTRADEYGHYVSEPLGEIVMYKAYITIDNL